MQFIVIPKLVQDQRATADNAVSQEINGNKGINIHLYEGR
ncbi:MAG: hypothetical protein HBSIN02_25610 [Bacteroidia bacterium]|nr:MAG: hypothetical protein HBSIN02_25610 [Bacteroidia bacterium]